LEYPAFIFPQVIDATMRSDWRACPHRFFRRHVQGLVPPGEVSVHLHFGGCLAKGLEVARREFFAGGSPDRALFNGCEAIIAAWGNFQGPANPNVNEKKKSLDACILSLAEYFKTWPLESDDVTIHVHKGEPGIEFSFAVPIPGSRHPITGDPILYAGRFDLIGDYLKAVWGLDDKTATSMSSAEKWRLRGQFTGLLLGITRIRSEASWFPRPRSPNPHPRNPLPTSPIDPSGLDDRCVASATPR
jgi:hypothetical protein